MQPIASLKRINKYICVRRMPKDYTYELREITLIVNEYSMEMQPCKFLFMNKRRSCHGEFEAGVLPS